MLQCTCWNNGFSLSLLFICSCSFKRDGKIDRYGQQVPLSGIGTSSHRHIEGIFVVDDILYIGILKCLDDDREFERMKYKYKYRLVDVVVRTTVHPPFTALWGDYDRSILLYNLWAVRLWAHRTEQRKKNRMTLWRRITCGLTYAHRKGYENERRLHRTRVDCRDLWTKGLCYGPRPHICSIEVPHGRYHTIGVRTQKL